MNQNSSITRGEKHNSFFSIIIILNLQLKSIFLGTIAEECLLNKEE